MLKDQLPTSKIFRNAVLALTLIASSLTESCGARTNPEDLGVNEPAIIDGGVDGDGESCEGVLIKPSVSNITDVTRGQADATISCLDIRNTCPVELKVNKMQLHRYGAGSETDLHDVHLVNSPLDKAQIDPETQGVSLKVKVALPAHSTVIVCIAADIQQTATCDAEHGFEIISPENVTVVDVNGDTIATSNISGPPVKGGLAKIQCEPGA